MYILVFRLNISITWLFLDPPFSGSFQSSMAEGSSNLGGTASVLPGSGEEATRQQIPNSKCYVHKVVGGVVVRAEHSSK